MSIQPVNSQPFVVSKLEPSGLVKGEVSTARRHSEITPKGPAATSAISPEDAIAAMRETPLANNRESLDEAVRRIREFVRPINDSIQFSIDEETGRTIVRVIDLQTQQVLRQIPSEEALNIAKALDKLQGLLIQNKA
jgi:flagellar protein FlaG